MSNPLIKTILFRLARIGNTLEQERRKRFPDRWRLLRLEALQLMLQERLVFRHQRPAFAMISTKKGRK